MNLLFLNHLLFLQVSCQPPHVSGYQFTFTNKKLSCLNTSSVSYIHFNQPSIKMTGHDNWQALWEGLRLEKDSKASRHITFAHPSLTRCQNGEGFTLRSLQVPEWHAFKILPAYQ